MMNKVLDMSTQSSNNNKRMAKNTLLLYFRMLLIIRYEAFFDSLTIK